MATGELVLLERNTSNILKDLGQVIASADGTLGHIDTLVTDMEALPATLTRLAENANRLTVMGQSAGDQLNQITLPRMNAALNQLTRATLELRDFTRIMRKDPQSLLMGRQRPAPGPVEVGHRAFGQ